VYLISSSSVRKIQPKEDSFKVSLPLLELLKSANELESLLEDMLKSANELESLLEDIVVEVMRQLEVERLEVAILTGLLLAIKKKRHNTPYKCSAQANSSC
jgi:hypothetical protein